MTADPGSVKRLFNFNVEADYPAQVSAAGEAWVIRTSAEGKRTIANRSSPDRMPTSLKGLGFEWDSSHASGPVMDEPRDRPEPSTQAANAVSDSTPTTRLSVVIPVYNEAATIHELVRRVVNAKTPEGLAKEIVWQPAKPDSTAPTRSRHMAFTNISSS